MGEGVDVWWEGDGLLSFVWTEAYSCKTAPGRQSDKI